MSAVAVTLEIFVNIEPNMIIAIYSFFAFLYLILIIFCLYTVYAFITGAPFVPTARKRVRKMIALSGLKNGQTMMDLGSGDGRIVFQAAKSGAQAIGIEINPILYYWSLLKKKLRRAHNASFKRMNLWDVDLSDVDVLTLFFIYPKMESLGKKIKKEMKPGTCVVSYAFRFPGWQYEKNDGKIYLYRV